MKAIVITAPGGPEVLAVRDLPDPVPGPGEVLIQVRAFGLNHADAYMRSGAWGKVAQVPGIECAGTVAADPEVAAVVRGHHARLENCFTTALRTAQRRGEIPAAVDPVARAKGLVAASQGLMVIGKANPDEEVLRAIVDSAFAGLM